MVPKRHSTFYQAVFNSRKSTRVYSAPLSSMLICPFVFPACKQEQSPPHQTLTTYRKEYMQRHRTYQKIHIVTPMCLSDCTLSQERICATASISVCFPVEVLGLAGICALALLQADRQTYTCGMWREAPAYNNHTTHTHTHTEHNWDMAAAEVVLKCITESAT